MYQFIIQDINPTQNSVENKVLATEIVAERLIILETWNNTSHTLLRGPKRLGQSAPNSIPKLHMYPSSLPEAMENLNSLDIATRNLVR